MKGIEGQGKYRVQRKMPKDHLFRDLCLFLSVCPSMPTRRSNSMSLKLPLKMTDGFSGIADKLSTICISQLQVCSSVVGSASMDCYEQGTFPRYSGANGRSYTPSSSHFSVSTHLHSFSEVHGQCQQPRGSFRAPG